MGPENQMGTEFSFSLIVIIAILFCMPFVAIASTDYYEIGNAKDSVDKEVKKAITTCLVKLVEDAHSANREISVDPEELKRQIKDLAESSIRSKYQLDFVIEDIQMIMDEKYYVTYQGHITYAPLIFKGDEFFEIPVNGRSKVQRFDKT